MAYPVAYPVAYPMAYPVVYPVAYPVAYPMGERESCRRLKICNNDSPVFYPLQQRKVHFVQMQTGYWDQTNNSPVIDCFLCTLLSSLVLSHHSCRTGDRQCETMKPSMEKDIVQFP